MKGELPTFNDCAKYAEGKAIPGDFVPKRECYIDKSFGALFRVNVLPHVMTL